MIAQPGLCRTRSETPKTGFLTTRLKCSSISLHFHFNIMLTHQCNLDPLNTHFYIVKLGLTGGGYTLLCLNFEEKLKRHIGLGLSVRLSVTLALGQEPLEIGS